MKQSVALSGGKAESRGDEQCETAKTSMFRTGVGLGPTDDGAVNYTGLKQ